MPFDDLRGFLAALDSAGQLLRITDEVDAEPDLGAAAAAATRLGERPPACPTTRQAIPSGLKQNSTFNITRWVSDRTGRLPIQAPRRWPWEDRGRGR